MRKKKNRFGRPGSRKPVSACLMAGASTKTFSQTLNPKARSSDIPYPKFTQGPRALGPKYILFVYMEDKALGLGTGLGR